MEGTGKFPVKGGAVSVLHDLNRNRILWTLILLFVLALFYGAVLTAQADDSFLDQIMLFVRQYLDAKRAGDFGQSFSAVFLPLGSLLLCGFVSGFFVFGQPICCLLMLIWGLELGVVTGQLYFSFGMTGFFDCLGFTLPFAILFFWIYLFALKDSLRFSMLFLSLIFPRLGVSANPLSAKVYVLRYLFYFAAVAIVALIESVINLIFGGFVVF